jgi:solute:Na+ symporter, SSS family
MVSLAPLDWACIALMWILSCTAAFTGRSRSESTTERIVAGRRLTLPAMVATLVATWYGDLFGVTQIAFERGIYMFFTQGVCWYVAYISFALFVARRLRRTQALSLCDLVRQRYGRNAAYFVAVAMLASTLPLTCAVGGGVLFQLLWGLPLPIAMAVAVIIAALLTQADGLGGVVRSDGVQFLFMCTAVALVAGYSILKWGGLGFLSSHLPQSHLTIEGQASWRAMVVWIGIASSMTFLNPAFCQRCLAARDEKVAQRGVLAACGVWVLFDLCTLLGGLYARALQPDGNPVDAYYRYGLQLLPVGLRGIFVAGVIATVISTLDSFLLVASSVLIDDLELLPGAPMALRKWGSLTLCCLLTVTLPFFFRLDAESIWLWADGLFSCSVLLPLLLGRLLRLQGRGFLICGLCGAAGMILARLLGCGMDAFFIGHLSALVALLSGGALAWKKGMFSSLPTANP